MARDDGRQPTIATAALAGRLLAEADFSRSGRRKMAGRVLDNRTTAVFAGRLLTKAGLLHSEHAWAA